MEPPREGQRGLVMGEYARTHAVSQNTVYTHPRRIRRRPAATVCMS